MNWKHPGIPFLTILGSVCLYVFQLSEQLVSLGCMYKLSQKPS